VQGWKNHPFSVNSTVARQLFPGQIFPGKFCLRSGNFCLKSGNICPMVK
jgi:hypothetical protein